MIALVKKITKKFNESCRILLKKMQDFEDNYFCNRCNSDDCKHFRTDLNKKFEKEIEENSRLVVTLAKSVFKEVPEVSCQELAC